MRIAVTGDGEYTDFLVGMLAAARHKVTVIGREKEFCEHVCGEYNVKAIWGDPCQETVLREAGIRDFDVVAALGREDTDNFEICQMCRKIFGVGRAVCLVRNPRNVELFEKLGIDQAVNVPGIIAGMIVKS